MDAVFDHMTAWIAPILVFTMEEAWGYRHGKGAGSVHLRILPESPSAWTDATLAARWEKLRDVRRVVTGALEVERREKRIGASLEASPTLFLADDALAAAVKGVDLAELFISSSVTVERGDGPAGAFRVAETPGVAVVAAASPHRKCQRCWRYTDDIGAGNDHPDACGRCADAVDRMDGASK
jgi:isoleucyl-tRNA synthetase